MPEPSIREYNFDGLAGPTHTHAGLSPGNLASQHNRGDLSNPRLAALQGLAKMRTLRERGIGQAILPPHERPQLSVLRRLGLSGSDSEILRQAASGDGALLQLCSSSSAMWTANAATVAPACDTLDGRLHLTVANLTYMFHRSLEAETTERIFRAIFSDSHLFAVHSPVPSNTAFSDEGAANHTRLSTSQAAVHLFGWGRCHFHPQASAPTQLPARQTREASQAVANLNALALSGQLLWQQAPQGIDRGAFHSDVLSVGTGSFLLLHEYAYRQPQALLRELESRLGGEFSYRLVPDRELSAALAVSAYPFNSQLISLADDSLLVVAPRQAEQEPSVKQLFDRLLAEDNPIAEVQYLDVSGSMKNGGGPACLRLRVPLTDKQHSAIGPRVFLDEALDLELVSWIEKYYRDRLSIGDLADPQLYTETMQALDDLTQILRLGSVYEFQI